jgi:hypothetical protein
VASCVVSLLFLQSLFLFIYFCLLHPSMIYSWGVLFLVYLMKLEFSTSNFV